MSTPTSPPPSAEPRGRVLLRVGLPALFGVVWWSTLCASPFVCVPALFTHGAVIDRCPSGALLPHSQVLVESVARNQTGWVRVSPRLEGRDEHDLAISGQPRSVSVRLSLLRAGSETPEPLGPAPDDPEEGAWQDDGPDLRRRLRLPADLPDGIHTLRAALESSAGDEVIDVSLPVFAPARVHLLSDRPRYEAGQTVLLRAVALRAADLSPLAGRPGRWRVRDPSGELVLDEAATTDDWGIVAGSFPIAPGALEGEWTASWESGSDTGSTAFLVAPFTLPRFSVSAQPARPWHLPGDRPTLRATATYASGAPVADAAVELVWRAEGDWQPPTDWLAGTLPVRARTDARGALSLALPAVPDDLVGTATLVATLTVVDPAGDRQQSQARVRLSADAVAGELVTETGDTLLEGFNNRAWVRLTRPDGQALPDVALTVKRAWDPTDPGTTVQTDADGVARLQLDPGPPVNLELPTPPVRPPPPPAPVELGAIRDELRGQSAALATRQAIEGQQALLARCAPLLQHGSFATRLTLDRRADGRVVDAVVADTEPPPLVACLQAAALRLRLPAGTDELLTVQLHLNAPDLPTLAISVEGWPGPPSEVRSLWDDQLGSARACLPDDQRSQTDAVVMRLRVRRGDRAVRTETVSHTGLSAASLRCIEAAIGDRLLDAPAGADSLGRLRLRTRARSSRRSTAPAPRTMLGYALALSARVDGEDLGQTTLHVRPGAVPAMRLRASPVVATSGGTVEVELLRGPDFVGKLAERYRLVHADGRAVDTKRAPDSRTLRFVLPDDAAGWWTVQAHGATARVFVPGSDLLDVRLTADRPAYAPGDEATLTVRTTRDGKGLPAAVGLIGVDETMGQIATLPGPDALAALRPTVQSAGAAFGALEAAALGRGLIRGENAREAVILKVTGVPSPASLDRPVTAVGRAPFDPEGLLVGRFYRVLARHQADVRAWERSAPPAEQLTPARNAAFWSAALAAVEADGDPVTDAFDRRLRLHRLPGDLLDLTDPRAVATDGTRLPEDIENWTAWVFEEKP